MNKNDLIVSPAEELELTRSYARDLVDTIFQKITEAASQGEEVAVFGFGRFKVVVRGARKGRNPRTGEAVQIAAKKVLKFEAAKAMKDGLKPRSGDEEKQLDLRVLAIDALRQQLAKSYKRPSATSLRQLREPSSVRIRRGS